MLIEAIVAKKFTLKPLEIYILIGFSSFYLIWTQFLIGGRVDHLAFYLFIVSVFLLHQETRKFVIGFVFFIFFWIIYDGLRAFPNYEYNEVHLLEPYLLEIDLFGIAKDGVKITPNEYFRFNANPLSDALAGIFYLTWVPIPLGYAVYLYFNNKEMLLKFSSCYLLTNLIGFIGYYMYPAAPPWYFDMFGTELKMDTVGNAAQLINFDGLVGYPLFEGIYTKNSNVFAAIPSLHAAYPVVTYYFARKMAPKWLKWLILIDIIGIWWAAVYSFHHYIIDVLLGFICAIFSIIVFEKLLMKSKFSEIIRTFANYIK